METVGVTAAKQQKYWNITSLMASLAMPVLSGLWLGLSGCAETTANVTDRACAIPSDDYAAESGGANLVATLGYKEIDEMSMVTIRVPPIPGKFDIWCYEGPLDKPVTHQIDGGILTLTHRVAKATVTTRFEPAEDGLRRFVTLFMCRIFEQVTLLAFHKLQQSQLLLSITCIRTSQH